MHGEGFGEDGGDRVGVEEVRVELVSGVGWRLLAVGSWWRVFDEEGGRVCRFR